VSSESRRRVLEWDSRIDRLGYEEILRVPIDSTVDTCRQAYYRFAQAFHPESHVDADPLLRIALTRIFQQGVEAYRVLTDPRLRAQWAIARSQGAFRLADSSVGPELDLADELRELHLHCRSAGAKLSAKQATTAFCGGRLDACEKFLLTALDYEQGANLYITRCLEALPRSLATDVESTTHRSR
jgi:curved DNA-binding protein CbpA